MFTARHCVTVPLLSFALAALLADGARADGDDGPLPKPGYVRKLREAAVARGNVDGLDVTVRLIPDIYRYEMALAMEELYKRGSSGSELLSKLRSAQRKHVKKKRDMLLLVEIAPRGGGYVFITTSLKRHFRLEVGSKKTFQPKILTRPQPKAQRWEIYEYPPNQPRRITRRALVHVAKPLEIAVTARRPSGKSSDPVVLSLAGVARQEKRAESTNSINARLRQISCSEWSNLVLEEAQVRFYPRKYKRPEPPRKFETLLQQLESDR